jgi:translation initiation factor IF-3
MAFNQQPQKRHIRVNNYITNISQVRLFIEDEPVGIVSIDEARRRAYDLGLDLVEIVPHAKPPVCKIIDFGKFKYEEKIKKKDEVRKQKTVASKEIQLRYCTGEHDLETKVGALKKFLEEKRQVRIVMKFKNREMAFKKQGEELFQKVAVMIESFGTFIPPKLEGKNLIAQVNPK